MSKEKYINKIWQNMARKQLENELNFLTPDNERIKLPIDDSIDYLKMYSDTHKTPEEELQERIDKAIELIEKQKYYDDIDNCAEQYDLGTLEVYKLLDILRGEK